MDEKNKSFKYDILLSLDYLPEKMTQGQLMSLINFFIY